MLDESMSWEKHIHTVETKLAKKYWTFEKSLKNIYFAHIYSYLNYANIAWASTYKTKLKPIHFHQKRFCKYCLQ